MKKTWVNPLLLTVICILVGVIGTALGVEHTGDFSYDMKVLTRVPMFLGATGCILVAGASLAEFSWRVRERWTQ